MVMKKGKIKKENLASVLSEWREQLKVLVPASVNGDTALTEWEGNDTGFINWYRNLTKPVKSIVLPPVEVMFHFGKDDNGYHLEVPDEKQPEKLVFGIRSCDARAISILDTFFQEGYQDNYYLNKRKNTFLVGLSCLNPCSSCFCTSLGISPVESNEVDLMVTDIGDSLIVETISQRGEELFTASGIEEISEADEGRWEQLKESAYNKVAKQINTDGIDKKLVECFEDDVFWQRIGEKCLSCGICTLLCPTCYCFDINDELIKDDGQRVRSWDSCAFPVYTKMPMENPREVKWRRIRQKVCHKYEFHPMNFGVIACTGCGRCLRYCPVNWDITQVLNSLPVGK